ncbi:orotidine 5'-phosphate decarboxylase [Paenibacillus darwinianus]|uniref:Orotidine 5'-phosphate decarboxylase n=2 Tax=Paenibacillus darwinianus TaxID=1380763 RepID=A0A9W5S366_9BACL|nr:orotidine 5'-phosphate decarboxylase [Paenibacillus darwinianus]EXX92600.1 orotidine 5'-phosphate decarboxylase [Paenibacillus darwinianus]EXX92663.1 orotidine 5'-phosphate decarboxylase [Paenibacillus darwinianus]
MGATLTREQAADRIMVALDYPDACAAEALIRRLEGVPCWMKVGMQLFYAAGPAFVAGLKERGYRVFLDVKMHDIPNTVKGGAGSIARLGVDLFNVHAAGGVRMMEAAMEGVEAARSGGGASLKRPTVIAVTQLTSTSQAVLNDEIGIPGTADNAVLRYAQLARQAGLDGVVASPQEVVAIKAVCGASFITVTPGIRPAGSATNDQSRIMTPREALEQGTDFMVIGRPITAAVDPRQAIETIIEELI